MRLFRILTTVALICTFAIAQTRFPAVPDMSSAAYPGTVMTAPYSAPSQSTLTGQVQLAVKLQDPPLVVAVGANAKQNGITMTAGQQSAYLAQLKQKQDAVMSQIRGLGGVELGRVSKGHNALMVSIDARRLPVLRGISGVIAVRPITDYEVSFTGGTPAQPDLATTLAYVGGVTAQNAGYKGQGVQIAMLDTGIDYTHYNLGGSGNVADYAAAKAVADGTPPPSFFPTSKVIGGFDFTGETWPNGPLAPDANPIDLNGHGTLTADTAAGHSLDGIHFGAAPGAQLYAVKVCSSVSTSCSGIAMAEGIDFALDPNNTGTLNNAVDIISMSTGGAFGQREDDVSEMLTDVVNFGVVSVISAGDDGNIPYIVAHPAATPEVLSLAATSSVVAFGIPLVINSPGSIAGTYTNTATVDWAPVNTTVTSNVVYVGRGCPASGGTPADPYLASPSGAIALIDRGVCSVSLKVDRAANAGAVGVLIGLVAAGDAVSFSNGGGSNFVPTLVITQSTSNTIKGALGTSAVNATLSSSNAVSLAGNVASYSSRGPNYSYNMLKPDMSAPGTIMGAQFGTGNGQFTESGTSFACPITAGSAAVLLSKNHNLSPLDVKALLMENTEPAVYSNALTQPGVLGPLSRTGAGELRVDRAASSTTSVWDASNPLSVSMSFGTYRVSANQTFKKKVVVRNYSNTSRIYTIGNAYRDAPNTTGFTLSYPPAISVPANGSASFTVSATVSAASLPSWTLNGGSNGGSGDLLNTVEYAGYLTFTDSNDTVHLPWHILPHKSANVQTGAGSLVLNGNIASLPISNLSAPIDGQTDAFSLTGTGVQFPPSVLPAPGSDYAVINLQATGVRLVCISNCTTTPVYGVQFAVTTFGQRSHPDYPAEFDVDIDANNDGQADFVVFNEDIGYASSGVNSGQNGVFVANLAANPPVLSGPFFYTSADLDSANAILTVPLSALSHGAVSVTVNQPFTFSVLAFDNYYTGNLTDSITGMKYELDMPQEYTTSSFAVTAGTSGSIPVVPNNAAHPYFSAPYNGNSPSQKGILFLYTNGKTGQESSSVLVTP
jgi:subtilisin family serine protease